MNNSIALRDRFLELQKILEAQLILGRDREYKLTALQRNIAAVLTKHHMRPSEVIDHGARSLACNSLVSRSYIPVHEIDSGNTKSYQAKPRDHRTKL